jgi:hypothetical protein
MLDNAAFAQPGTIYSRHSVEPVKFQVGPQIFLQQVRHEPANLVSV